MTKKVALSNAYLLLAVLYILKSILYQRGTLFSQSISGLFVISTIILALAAVSNTKLPRVLKSYLVFVAVLVLYGIVLYLSGETITVQYTGAITGGSQYLEAILYSNMPIFACYYLSKKNYFSSTHLKFWLVVFFVVTIVSYFYYQIQAVEAKMNTRFDDEVTNNASYLFVAFIPMLCLFEKQRIIQYAGLTACFVFLLMGMKRGALLTGVVEIFAILLFNIRSETKIKKLRYIVLGVIFVGLAYLLFHKMLNDNDYFAYRYELTLEGYSSGRDVITSQILNYFKNEMSFFDMLFGRGALATVKMFINYAHNDWLELMVCHGFLGVILYLFFYIRFISTSIKARDSQTKISLIVIFVAMFLPSLFSMSYNTVSFSLACYFGYIAAKI